MEPVPVDLSGVPQTLLWNLGRRAAAARASGLIDDPLAMQVADRLEYDFGDASQGARWHAVRVATFDAAVRHFVTQHPGGTVVALGEGLETQFWRVDNRRVRWLSVDLPAIDQAIELWLWLFTAGERAALSQIRGVAAVRDLVPPLAPGLVPVILRAVRCLPRRVRYALPVLPVLQLTFSAHRRDRTP